MLNVKHIEIQYDLFAGLFIPIGMLPESDRAGGLPDMASVTEMMQKHASQEAVSGDSETNEGGAPPQNIKEVNLL